MADKNTAIFLNHITNPVRATELGFRIFHQNDLIGLLNSSKGL